MLRIQRILVPTDFSDIGSLAVEYGLAIAKQFDSDLHLLHVIDDYLALAPEAQLALPDRKTFMQELNSAAMEELAKVPSQPLTVDRVKRHTTVGRPFEAIVQFAKEQQIDLIVIGSHGRRGISHLLLGSVAERVVRLAGCPVLTVRPDQHQFVLQNPAVAG